MTSRADTLRSKAVVRPIAQLVTGLGYAAPGAHADLAWRAAADAKYHGLRVLKIARSHSTTGASHYVKIVDKKGQRWTIRISDHLSKKQQEMPHFDLVSYDGIASPWVMQFIYQAALSIADGKAQWFEPTLPAARKPALTRKPTPRAFDGRKCA
jgi:hypothetical protein